MRAFLGSKRWLEDECGYLFLQSGDSYSIAVKEQFIFESNEFYDFDGISKFTRPKHLSRSARNNGDVKVFRIYADMCGDLFHFGHSEFLSRALLEASHRLNCSPHNIDIIIGYSVNFAQPLVSSLLVYIVILKLKITKENLS